MERQTIDVALVEDAARGLDDPVYYLCGLPEMVRGIARGLLEAGIPRERLMYEAFWGYEQG